MKKVGLKEIQDDEVVASLAAKKQKATQGSRQAGYCRSWVRNWGEGVRSPGDRRHRSREIFTTCVQETQLTDVASQQDAWNTWSHLHTLNLLISKSHYSKYLLKYDDEGFYHFICSLRNRKVGDKKIDFVSFN